MKKNYFAPESEVVELQVKTALLAGSGGGVGDDYSSDKDDTPSTNPDDDFGW